MPEVFYNETVRAFCTPTFDEFLMRISGGDTMLISRIWAMLGYIITPDNFGRAFFVLQGVPASGKSTIERLLVRMFSRGSVFKVNGEELGTKFVFQGLECMAFIIVFKKAFNNHVNILNQKYRAAVKQGSAVYSFKNKKFNF